MNDDREKQPPLEPWELLVMLYIRCGEHHRQADGHRCELHDELDRRDAVR